ncbi:hypothetical protein [Asticcacaulis solisilvae]|uniref:hypothetical protein n=1 Tax=Asticcacaulis solisilvae TaxID=1217274 RepID=UPI003FD718C5
MRYLRLYLIGLALAVLSAAWAWNRIDLALNYTQVAGTVISADEACRVEKQGDAVTRKAEVINEMPCDAAMVAVQAGQAYAGYGVEAGTDILYNYVSPVDHAVHSGKLWRDGDVDLGPVPGDAVAVYASKATAGASKFVTR